MIKALTCSFCDGLVYDPAPDMEAAACPRCSVLVLLWVRRKPCAAEMLRENSGEPLDRFATIVYWAEGEGLLEGIVGTESPEGRRVSSDLTWKLTDKGVGWCMERFGDPEALRADVEAAVPLPVTPRLIG